MHTVALLTSMSTFVSVTVASRASIAGPRIEPPLIFTLMSVSGTCDARRQGEGVGEGINGRRRLSCWLCRPGWARQGQGQGARAAPARRTATRLMGLEKRGVAGGRRAERGPRTVLAV